MFRLYKNSNLGSSRNLYKSNKLAPQVYPFLKRCREYLVNLYNNSHLQSLCQVTSCVLDISHHPLKFYTSFHIHVSLQSPNVFHSFLIQTASYSRIYLIKSTLLIQRIFVFSVGMISLANPLTFLLMHHVKVSAS